MNIFFFFFLQLSALPEGWKIVDANNNPVELSRYQVIVNVLPVDSTLKVSNSHVLTL